MRLFCYAYVARLTSAFRCTRSISPGRNRARLCGDWASGFDPRRATWGRALISVQSENVSTGSRGPCKQDLMTQNSITFLASFPPIGSAIKVSGDGGGMRLQLDVPETELVNAALLLAWRQKRLRVTVEVLDDNGIATPTRRTAKRRV